MITQSRIGALSVAEWDVVRKRKRSCCGADPRPLRRVKYSSRTSAQEVFLMEEKDQQKKRSTFRLPVKTLCYTAVIVALSVVCNVFTVYMSFAGSNALSFTYTVCFIAGAFFGPFVGFLVGALGDLLGWVINSTGGAFNPLITLTSGLIGFIPGIVFMIAKKLKARFPDKKWIDPCAILVSFVIVWLICTNLNTVIMYYFYIAGHSKKYTALGAYYVFRIPFQTLFWAMNLPLAFLLYYPLKKFLKL